MKEKTSCVIVTFHTSAEAMATRRICDSLGLPGKLISAPRAISADCGIAWKSPVSCRGELEQAIKENKIEVAGFHEMLI